MALPPSPLPPGPLSPGLVSLADYEHLAARRLAGPAWAYLSGAADDGLTAQDNRAAFARLRLRPRALADLRGGHTRLRLLGQDLEHPILVAPSAYHRLFHPEGEAATLAGATALRAPVVVSAQASLPLEPLAQGASPAPWFQLYIQPDRAFTLALLRRVEAAGYAALVVTVDAPVSLRQAEERAGFRLPPGIGPVNLEGAALPPAPALAPHEPGILAGPMAHAARWEDIAALRAATRLPLLLKGILTPEDAAQALAAGADGLIVSNHGGRVLDGLPASLDALPGVARQVAGRVPVLLDGGIRRGTDVLKALALGARAVLVGRPVLHGLAVGGALGVAHVLKLLRAELEVAMAQTGCATLEAITPDVLWPAKEGAP
ncbi:alpha-hydroxy-acid oxidizing protein [Roseomonas sp. GC11]|uniref:alpha-hydroxy acid oxidase n=1 Tax=Roseomonas sp. GC11 TaxID=2950546 RepID=UPI00210B1E0A|nr:alpha-hydroxy acid oxidase [Roseomonas sp. GC11]MCQ4160056.1 alpha-hydroxy-acid oxidizing protein [Roseomonas sp. GC11]